MSQIITDENFENEVLKSEVPVLVDFFAEWCGPCKVMAPLVDELAEEMKNDQVKIFKLNVDESPQTAEKYNVMSIPTTIIFKSGEEKDRLVGLQSKESLKTALTK
jgi:thioredoxin 1